jgi:FixJ family two-component response regulator
MSHVLDQAGRGRELGARLTGTEPTLPGLIAVVDDDASFREAMTDILLFWGFGVEAFESAEDVLARSGLEAFDAFLLDVQMPGLSGLQLIDRLREVQVTAPVILVTSCNDAATRKQAARAGALSLLGKPFNADELIGLLRQALSGA